MKKPAILLIFMAAAFLIYSVFPAGNMISAMSDSRASVRLPVLLYHSICIEASGENQYTVSTERFESDLIWLKDHGFTSVSASQLIGYVENGSPLPSKPVLITFDDGYMNNYSLAFPLLQKYHMNAVVSVIGRKCDESSGDMYPDLATSALNWGQVALMNSSGLVEIGNHTFDLHKISGGRKGADRLSGESDEDYAAVLTADLSHAQEKIAAACSSPNLSKDQSHVRAEAPSIIFAWPYGAYPSDGSADPILKELGFKMTLTSYQKVNTVYQGEPDSLFGLKRFLRDPGFDMEDII